MQSYGFLHKIANPRGVILLTILFEGMVAFRTYALDHVVYRASGKAWRQSDRRHCNAFKTCYLMAILTVEVNMHIAVLIAMMPAAQLVLYYPATVLNAMDEVMLLKHCKRPEYARLLKCANVRIQFAEAEGMRAVGEFAEHKDSVGCRLDACQLYGSLYIFHAIVPVMNAQCKITYINRFDVSYLQITPVFRLI